MLCFVWLTPLTCRVSQTIRRGFDLQSAIPVTPDDRCLHKRYQESRLELISKNHGQHDINMGQGFSYALSQYHESLGA